jgi:gliding motility-associated-like protein
VVLTATDNCDTSTEVIFSETITNNGNCAVGYSIIRTWSAIDCAGNENSHTQTITIEPTGPITANNYEEEVTIICGDDIPGIPDIFFTGGCGYYEVEFSEQTEFSEESDDYLIIRTWNVIDICGSQEIFEQMIFVLQPRLEEIEIDICVEDSPLDLIGELPSSFDTNGVFILESGNAVLNGSIFNPADLEIGEYRVSYNSIEGTCKYYAEFTINVNSDCVPCGRDEIEVSKTVTPNGDNINETLEITGVEYCGYTFEIMIFNRWGDKVYESPRYENDWSGFSPSASFGSSDILPAGTYYYIIKVNEKPEFAPFNGFIYLGNN